MGRKKSKRKAQKTISRLRTLQTLFECPFCNHESSCDVKFDRKKQRAQIFCRICLETYETDVNCKYETQNKI
jgi:transcription elongation factor Elf1